MTEKNKTKQQKNKNKKKTRSYPQDRSPSGLAIQSNRIRNVERKLGADSNWFLWEADR